MDMYSNGMKEFKTTVNNDTLPFLLYLNIGNKKIYITHLTEDLKNVFTQNYEIEEYQNLTLGIESNKREYNIKINWDKNFHDLEEDTEIYHLSPQKKEIELFNYDNNTPYPWSIGHYLFEVEYATKKYYGTFSIVPKNISENQFSKIHDFLNEKLEGITNEVLKFNTVSNFDKNILKKIPSFIFFKWYLQIENKLFNALNIITKDTDTKRTLHYAIENIPKHIDRKSIRWKSTFKGQIYSNKTFNRKYITNVNTINNQIVKKRIIGIKKRLEEVKYDLYIELRNIEALLEEAIEKIKLFEKELVSIQFNKTVAYSSKKRLENNIEVEKQKIEKYTNDIKDIEEMENRLNFSIKKIKTVLNNEFWLYISDFKAKGQIHSASRGYLLFDSLYKKFKQFEKGEDINFQISTVFKSTAVLYEYYVYFVVIECLLLLDFEFPENYDLKKQLLSYFYKEGLRDGTTVKLVSVKNKLSINVIYNEEVETSSEMALKKNKNFFTNQFNKKPDIKLDLYEITESEKFISSFIFEVKYRPLHNIYQKIGATATMVQMENYRAINYIKENGKLEHRIIEEVICVYPGSDKKNLLIQSDYGYFLQLFPNNDSDSSTIIGLEEMKEKLKEWINNYKGD